MKRLIRPVKASTELPSMDIVFNPKEVVALLKEINELKDKDIKLGASPDGYVEFIIGDVVYTAFPN